jgi:hypothetical protein
MANSSQPWDFFLALWLFISQALFPGALPSEPSGRAKPVSGQITHPTLTAAAAVTPSPTPTPAPVTLTGAGDIAICGNPGAKLTARLLESIPGMLFTAGDNSNASGEPQDYQQCFDPTWGKFRERIRPAIGNHDARVANGQAYYDYFGEAAGLPGQGYYSYEAGSWHIIVLNSDCQSAGGCEPGSAQVEWLKQDLAAHPNLCTLAYWHHPLFTSGTMGPSDWVRPFWDALYAAGAEIVVNGHDHHYERFTPLDPSGTPDAASGIRKFVAGTGGAFNLPLGKEPTALSERHIVDTFGVLKLTLFFDHYEWEFIPVEGSTESDQGSGVCHPSHTP